MKIIRLNTAAPPAQVRSEPFRMIGDVPEMGYWIRIGSDEIKVEEGDFIEVDDDNAAVTRVIFAADFTRDAAKRQQVLEAIGRQVVRDIWQALDQASDVMKAGITTTIIATIVACQSGQVHAAREIANGTPTGGAFTAQRKAALLDIIDQAIAKL